ncbi:8-oxoguanine DNA glycosylase domain-containing protein [Methanofollis liminatans DSM 4140]|uniref:DNA-(apurinic or apyrimidinic site) lyase n=1 Tax=Methanofollis liminatans DSM 4140 TaxID=28892 RepID=J1ANR5_9EURY|nr:DNA glycosylase [Methanofollis liminatans]EJG06523.1 8-oxoguanine DNA glycosylase domain-containing protein [Methanofollis liminatans DSM 4140]
MEKALRLGPGNPFNLDATLGCGQAFRWEKVDGTWYGVAGDHAIGIRQDGERLLFSGADEPFIRRYFALDLDLPAILSSVDRDPRIHAAIGRCPGLRILRQEPFETLISYICATNTNIPTIKKRIALIAERYGRRLPGGVSAFPDAAALAPCSEGEMRGCVLGYRAPYACATAALCAEDPGWAERVAALPYGEARRELLRFPGVGPKAADCILLFAFEKYEAFPVDVHIRRMMRRHYLPDLPEDKTMTCREYDLIAGFAREHFGAYAGWAQEYLFCVREEEQP